MKVFLSLLVWCCCAIPLAAQERPVSPSAEKAFHRSDRPLGFKVGFASMSPRAALGVQADLILFDRIGLEFAAKELGVSARARYYLLSGAMSPYVGIGTGMAFYGGGNWLGSWKEWHVGLEHAFAGGLVLQAQLMNFFDRRGATRERYTFAPGIGYRF